MTANIGVGGNWKQAKIYVGVGGVWKTLSAGWVGVGGVWKQFYSSNIPNPVSWSDITGDQINTLYTNEENAITGISTSIVLQLTYSGSSAPGAGIGYRLNGTGGYLGFSTVNVTVSNGTTLGFGVVVDDLGQNVIGSVTITNQSDGGALVGSFNVNVQGLSS